MLAHDWTELVELLDNGQQKDAMTRAQRLCLLSAEATGVTGVALSVHSGNTRSTVCATGGLADRLEELQDTLGEGPSVEAMRTGESVLVGDLAGATGRWPAFTAAASQIGLQATFALPLRVGAARIGTLALYRTEPGPLEDEQFRDAWTLAEAAAVMLTLSRAGGPDDGAFGWVLSDRSRFRPEVHQAVGVLMVRLGVDPEEAFARLCAHAYANATPLGRTAEAIVDGRLRLDDDRSD